MQSVAYLFLVARKQFRKLLDRGLGFGHAESPTSVSVFWQYDDKLHQEQD